MKTEIGDSGNLSDMNNRNPNQTNFSQTQNSKFNINSQTNLNNYNNNFENNFGFSFEIFF